MHPNVGSQCTEMRDTATKSNDAVVGIEKKHQRNEVAEAQGTNIYVRVISLNTGKHTSQNNDIVSNRIQPV